MKQFLLSIGFLCSFFNGFGQCPSKTITLTSQAAIDAFAVNYPDCTEFLNVLIILGQSQKNS